MLYLYYTYLFIKPNYHEKAISISNHLLLCPIFMQ